MAALCVSLPVLITAHSARLAACTLLARKQESRTNLHNRINNRREVYIVSALKGEFVHDERGSDMSSGSARKPTRKTASDCVGHTTGAGAPYITHHIASKCSISSDGVKNLANSRDNRTTSLPRRALSIT